MAMIRAWRCRAIAAVLVLVLAAGLAAQAAAPEGKAKVRETFASLRALNAAVKEEAEADARPLAVKLPPSPAKIVTSPTLGSAQLDDLVEKFLESAKVLLAAPTTDVEFVRHAYLDLTGKLPTPDQVRNFVNSGTKGCGPTAHRAAFTGSQKNKVRSGDTHLYSLG